MSIITIIIIIFKNEQLILIYFFLFLLTKLNKYKCLETITQYVINLTKNIARNIKLIMLMLF
jgi:hypothetical protein